MLINIQDDIQKLRALDLLNDLLTDKTTKQNIIWATDTYSVYGTGYGCRDAVTAETAPAIRTRAQKAMEQQSERTRQHAEVFSPFWVCKKMCDYADEAWDGKNNWKKYVNSRRLEITCGEAPFLVSRYDVETGEAVPIPDRIGLLDRKLRAVSENAQNEAEWLEWAVRAFWSAYGFELQGDNVLIARVNLLMTFEEYLRERWNRNPTISEYRRIVNIITWNIWQMDGLTGTIPYGIAEEEVQVIDWFGMFGGIAEHSGENKQPRCRIFNWTGNESVAFSDLPTRGKRAMKFDFIIGNPPYQDETVGEQKTFAPPIYHVFLDQVYPLADCVELIHPARFLFNAGSTPKAWNQKMLKDPHLKVLYYEQSSAKIFRDTDIKGGIAITCHDTRKDFGAIGTFTAFSELNSILQKITHHPSFNSFSNIVVTRTAYRLTDIMHTEHPEAVKQLSKGHPYDMATNIFETLPQIFFENMPQDGNEYIQILGRKGNERVYKYIKSSYINRVGNLYKYKVYIPKANGAGVLGEVLSPPVLAGPGVGATETFLSIGAFETEDEAATLLKYIKTKFARTLLGVLKTTQDITPQKWANVPLQDFSHTSDIDWSKSIPEIDQQLYTKYGLDKQEVEFIENRAKEMD